VEGQDQKLREAPLRQLTDAELEIAYAKGYITDRIAEVERERRSRPDPFEHEAA
jgi:hypothetical protein